MVAGSISAKIDDMLMHLPRCCGCRFIDPYCLRPWLGHPEREAPEWDDVCSWPQRLLGSLLYGVLFCPFALSLLQQTLMDGVAIDSFKSDRTLSRRAWVKGALAILIVFLYCVIFFTAFDSSWYEPGALKLTWLLFIVVALVLLQQALTVHYILLRPELSHLEKNPMQRKYHLCGRHTPR